MKSKIAKYQCVTDIVCRDRRDILEQKQCHDAKCAGAEWFKMLAV